MNPVVDGPRNQQESHSGASSLSVTVSYLVQSTQRDTERARRTMGRMGITYTEFIRSRRDTRGVSDAWTTIQPRLIATLQAARIPEVAF